MTFGFPGAAFLSLAGWVLVGLHLTSPAADGAESAPVVARRFDSRDSVEMATFTSEGDLAPDGSKFVVTTERGDLQRGVTAATLWVFDTAEVRHAIAAGSSITPIPLAQMSGAVSGPADHRNQVGARQRQRAFPGPTG